MKKKRQVIKELKSLYMRLSHTLIGSLTLNLLMAYVAMMICRLIFLAENWSILGGEITWSATGLLLSGSLLFDTSAICYLNAIYILLLLLPVHRWEHSGRYAIVKWAYVIPNSLAIIATLCDAVFYPFNNRRVTAMVFSEFGNEDNLGRIIGIEFINHWYLVLAAALMIFLMIRLYRSPRNLKPPRRLWVYYAGRIGALAVAAFLIATGMRGGSFFKATRPISINEAHRFVERPAQVAIVLNTPFSIIRTLTQTPQEIPHYFEPDELDALFSPLHQPADSAHFKPRNVVILIVESFAQEFVGARTRELDGGTYKGYTPFADSLLSVSLTYEQTIANAGFSIDAMPAVLASIPRMEHPFVLSPFSVNPINSIASILGGKGYESAFFHGATNQSLGFNAFAAHAGFDKYYGMDEYCEDPSTGGKADFDGTWGIWDEEFLQYFCRKIGAMHQPFVASVFTLSSHHPFAIPERYRERFPDEGKYPLHKCIRYTDNALRLFFEEAKKQPWYENTIFVLTADHASSKVTHDEYHTAMGHFRIPILFFDPSGRMPRGNMPGIMQQTDIMPTLLDYMGYDRPYIAFGKSMLSTSPETSWAFNWDNVKQYVYADYLMQLQGDKVTAIYNYKTDPTLKQNLAGTLGDIEEKMRRHALAIEQSFFTRANDSKLTTEQTKN